MQLAGGMIQLATGMAQEAPGMTYEGGSVFHDTAFVTHGGGAAWQAGGRVGPVRPGATQGVHRGVPTRSVGTGERYGGG